MQIQLEIDHSWTDIEQITANIEAEVSQFDGNISIQRADSRAIETAVLLAVISATTAALGALIQAICSVAKAKAQSKIIVQDRYGARIEIPVNSTLSEVERAALILSRLDAPRIQFRP